MENLVFFFRVGTCYLAAVCVIASYLGQMAQKQVLCPPDVAKLIRSFTEQDLCNYLVADGDGDGIEKLGDIVNQLSGEDWIILETNTAESMELEGEPPQYDLARKIKQFGPALVSNFRTTEKFHAAFRQNPARETGARSEDVAVGYIQFDMKKGQHFESVQGTFKELRPRRANRYETTLAEINSELKKAKEKLTPEKTLFDTLPEVKTKKKQKPKASKVGSKHGDKSVHIDSRHPDSVQSSRRRDTAAITHDDADLKESRELGDGSIGALCDGESNQSQVLDGPPATKKDAEEDNRDTHVMVCIGGRVDKNGRTFLLLQNSWSKMPLVEVSLEYFVASKAALSYVPKHLRGHFTKLGNKNCFYKVNKAFVADCTNPAL